MASASRPTLSRATAIAVPGPADDLVRLGRIGGRGRRVRQDRGHGARRFEERLIDVDGLRVGPASRLIAGIVVARTAREPDYHAALGAWPG